MSGPRVQFGQQIYQFWLDKGLPPAQAAAIAGNMAWEGGGRADLVNPNDNARNSPRSPHSVGIAQWNDRAPALIDFARKQGIEIPAGDMRDAGYMQDVIRRIPLQTQLEFAHNEMQGSEGRAFSMIRSAGDDMRAATAGAIMYHRPAGSSYVNPEAGHGFPGRLALAQQIMQAGSPKPASEGPNEVPESGLPKLALPPSAPPMSMSPGTAIASAEQRKPSIAEALADESGGYQLPPAVTLDEPRKQEQADAMPPIPMGMPRRIDLSRLQMALASRSPLGVYRS